MFTKHRRSSQGARWSRGTLCSSRAAPSFTEHSRSQLYISRILSQLLSAKVFWTGDYVSAATSLATNSGIQISHQLSNCGHCAWLLRICCVQSCIQVFAWAASLRPKLKVHHGTSCRHVHGTASGACNHSEQEAMGTPPFPAQLAHGLRSQAAEAVHEQHMLEAALLAAARPCAGHSCILVQAGLSAATHVFSGASEEGQVEQQSQPPQLLSAPVHKLGSDEDVVVGVGAIELALVSPACLTAELCGQGLQEVVAVVRAAAPTMLRLLVLDPAGQVFVDLRTPVRGGGNCVRALLPAMEVPHPGCALRLVLTPTPDQHAAVTAGYPGHTPAAEPAPQDPSRAPAPTSALNNASFSSAPLPAYPLLYASATMLVLPEGPALAELSAASAAMLDKAGLAGWVLHYEPLLYDISLVMEAPTGPQGARADGVGPTGPEGNVYPTTSLPGVQLMGSPGRSSVVSGLGAQPGCLTVRGPEHERLVKEVGDGLASFFVANAMPACLALLGLHSPC